MTTDLTTDLLTVNDIVHALGVNRQRVHQLARARGVGRRVGRDLLFTPTDLDILRPRRPAGRPRKDSTMTPDQIVKLINERGVREVANMIANPGAMARAAVEGYNLTHWQVRTGPGAVLFTRSVALPVTDQAAERRAQLRAQIQSCDTVLALYETDPQWTRMATTDAAWLAHVKAEARTSRAAAEAELATIPEPVAPAIEAHVLWLNAPETERARWEAIVAETESTAPTTLLLRGSAEADAFEGAMAGAAAAVFGAEERAPKPRRAREPDALLDAAEHARRRGRKGR